MNEFKWANTTGLTVYVIRIRNADGAIYNIVTPGYEAINGSNWAEYAITMTEQSGTGIYYGSQPAGLASTVELSDYWVCLQAGGSPAKTDAKIATGFLNWNGSADVISTFAAGGSVILASAGLDAVVVEEGINARQALSVIGAGEAGKVAGSTLAPIPGTITISAANNPGTNRITAEVDGAGNRTSVTLNLPE